MEPQSLNRGPKAVDFEKQVDYITLHAAKRCGSKVPGQAGDGEFFLHFFSVAKVRQVAGLANGCLGILSGVQLIVRF